MPAESVSADPSSSTHASIGLGGTRLAADNMVMELGDIGS